MLSWNVRGLNNRAKQGDIKQVINIFRPNIICLQETKIERIDAAQIRNTLGIDYDNNYVSLPA
jgi:exonuclease III